MHIAWVLNYFPWNVALLLPGLLIEKPVAHATKDLIEHEIPLTLHPLRDTVMRERLRCLPVIKYFKGTHPGFNLKASLHP